MLQRLGIITDEVSDEFEEALDFASHSGLSHVEIRSVRGANVLSLSDDEIVSIRKRIDERGLFVSCLASPVFKCALTPLRKVAHGDTFGATEGTVDEHMDLLLRALDVARLLGTSRVRIFSFWREQDPSSCTEEISHHLARACDLAESRGVTLLLENEPACNGGFAEEVSHLIRRVNRSALQALWDPGNEVYGGKASALAGYRHLSGALGHVHLKDVRMDGEGNPVCLPIGQGTVPFQEQFAMLRDDGYEGLFTLEPHYAPDKGTKRQGSEESLKGLIELWSHL